jgi:Polyketide cyclase / dehydrase and lipid transport
VDDELPRFEESIFVARPPDEVYDLVSDVTRMGAWSPICKSCWWEDGDGPRVGAVFGGRNESDGQVWETRSEVIAADRGHEFAWEVAGGWVRWTYRFEPDGAGTRLTESWRFLPAGRAGFHERYGDAAPARIALPTKQARRGIPATLAAIKQTAEQGSA